ncbi:unnamed protein product [Urochloa humidicola]
MNRGSSELQSSPVQERMLDICEEIGCIASQKRKSRGRCGGDGTDEFRPCCPCAGAERTKRIWHRTQESEVCAWTQS